MRVRLFIIGVSLFVIALSALAVLTAWNHASAPAAQPAAGAVVNSSVMSYQGVLNNASGAPVTGVYSMTFALYRTPAITTSVWSEVQLSVTVSNGLFNVYLGVAVAGDSEMTPRTRVAMVPYAYTANQVAC
jgi:hypothetical protein